jgi:hypothetical protein
MGVVRAQANQVHFRLDFLIVGGPPGDLLLLRHLCESEGSIVDVNEYGNHNSQYLLSFLVVVAVDC